MYVNIDSRLNIGVLYIFLYVSHAVDYPKKFIQEKLHNFVYFQNFMNPKSAICNSEFCSKAKRAKISKTGSSVSSYFSHK